MSEYTHYRHPLSTSYTVCALMVTDRVRPLVVEPDRDEQATCAGCMQTVRGWPEGYRRLNTAYGLIYDNLTRAHEL